MKLFKVGIANPQQWLVKMVGEWLVWIGWFEWLIVNYWLADGELLVNGWLMNGLWLLHLGSSFEWLLNGWLLDVDGYSMLSYRLVDGRLRVSYDHPDAEGFELIDRPSILLCLLCLLLTYYTYYKPYIELVVAAVSSISVAMAPLLLAWSDPSHNVTRQRRPWNAANNLRLSQKGGRHKGGRHKVVRVSNQPEPVKHWKCNGLVQSQHIQIDLCNPICNMCSIHEYIACLNAYLTTSYNTLAWKLTMQTTSLDSQSAS